MISALARALLDGVELCEQANEVHSSAYMSVDRSTRELAVRNSRSAAQARPASFDFALQRMHWTKCSCFCDDHCFFVYRLHYHCEVSNRHLLSIGSRGFWSFVLLSPHWQSHCGDVGQCFSSHHHDAGLSPRNAYDPSSCLHDVSNAMHVFGALLVVHARASSTHCLLQAFANGKSVRGVENGKVRDFVDLRVKRVKRNGFRAFVYDHVGVSPTPPLHDLRT